jgi:predicted nucleotide-binding protein
VFIGSSSQGLNVANDVQSLLHREFLVEVWNQGTIFGLGNATLEDLEAAVLAYDFGIFVFTPDDRLDARGHVRTVARDNVLFEFGLFVGKLTRRRMQSGMLRKSAPGG